MIKLNKTTGKLEDYNVEMEIKRAERVEATKAALKRLMEDNKLSIGQKNEIITRWDSEAKKQVIEFSQIENKTEDEKNYLTATEEEVKTYDRFFIKNYEIFEDCFIDEGETMISYNS